MHLYIIQGYDGALSRHMFLLLCLEVCGHVRGLWLRLYSTVYVCVICSGRSTCHGSLAGLPICVYMYMWPCVAFVGICCVQVNFG